MSPRDDGRVTKNADLTSFSVSVDFAPPAKGRRIPVAMLLAAAGLVAVLGGLAVTFLLLR